MQSPNSSLIASLFHVGQCERLSLGFTRDVGLRVTLGFSCNDCLDVEEDSSETTSLSIDTFTSSLESSSFQLSTLAAYRTCCELLDYVPCGVEDGQAPLY